MIFITKKFIQPTKNILTALESNMEFKHTNLAIENDYPKLVRDRMPEIIKQKEGIVIRSETISDDAVFLKYLAKKIVEEAIELQDSVSNGNLEEELADIFELIDNILKLKGKTTEDVVVIQNEKRGKNGGFEKRVLMLGKDKNS
jgi:predicted house-cleaning noncanonical NTP pyrophosphatase (MazG superfamily)